MRTSLISVLMIAAVAMGAETNEIIKLDEKVTVDSYSQGKITIGGRLIRTDILIQPDGTVVADWRTKRSHVLSEEDIKDLLAQQAETLIIGTGHQSLVKLTPELKKTLKEGSVEVFILRTDDAVKKLKELRGQGKKVSACFHVGC